LLAALVVGLGSLAVAWQCGEFLGDATLSGTLISPVLRERWLGGRAAGGGAGQVGLGLPGLVVGVVLWLVPGVLIAWRTGRPLRGSWARWGTWGWCWWLGCLIFPVGDLAAAALDARFPGTQWQAWWRGCLPFLAAHLIAGWVATLVALMFPSPSTGRAAARIAGGAMAGTAGAEGGEIRGGATGGEIGRAHV